MVAVDPEFSDLDRIHQIHQISGPIQIQTDIPLILNDAYNIELEWFFIMLIVAERASQRSCLKDKAGSMPGSKCLVAGWLIIEFSV